MTNLTRRTFALTSLAGLTVTAACGNGVGSSGGAEIDARVDKTLEFLYDNYPNTVEIAQKSVGQLVMPVITEAGFGFGAGYGRGALRVGGATVDYYSTTKGSFGLQIGASQFAHVLFFMTQESLSDFRRGSGWTAGGNVKFVIIDEGEGVEADTTTVLSPVIAVVFAQAGLKAGATIEGQKYTRIIP